MNHGLARFHHLRRPFDTVLHMLPSPSREHADADPHDGATATCRPRSEHVACTAEGIVPSGGTLSPTQITRMLHQRTVLRAHHAEAVGQVEEAKRALARTEADLLKWAVAVDEVEARIDTAVNAPVSSAHRLCAVWGSPDPTLWLPDEILTPILLHVPVVDIFTSCRLVCRRWYRLVWGEQVKRRMWACRWALYEMGAINPRWITVCEDSALDSTRPPTWDPSPTESSDDDTTGGESDGLVDMASFAVSRCGSRLYAGTWNNLIKVVDAKSGRLLSVLRGHSDTVSALELGADDKLYSGSYDGSVRVWDEASGVSTVLHTSHSCGVTALTVGEDLTVFSGAFDGRIYVWNAATDGLHHGRELWAGESGKVVGLVLCNTTLVSATEEGAIAVWYGPDFDTCDAKHCTRDIAALTVAPLAGNQPVVWALLRTGFGFDVAWARVDDESPPCEGQFFPKCSRVVPFEPCDGSAEQWASTAAVQLSNDGIHLFTALASGDIKIWTVDGAGGYTTIATLNTPRLDQDEIEGLVLGPHRQLFSWEPSGVWIW